MKSDRQFAFSIFIQSNKHIPIDNKNIKIELQRTPNREFVSNTYLNNHEQK